MCNHNPACPAGDAIDWRAARNITEHPGQGRTLPGNGALVFDDSSVEQMQGVFHELHGDGRHTLCAVCGGQYRQPAGKATGGVPRSGGA